ncbi:lysophospholipase L1-like esterase [Paenibacillus phyllosphaerae]|uniref:Lysophospholipase L1-like esterase n=1 Tax=Paenibacillus phyllosphaerae TaxID=274593 RepID=A0A7W5ASX1_9BACL|nr:SGNH/GDSL hydrolase family protein [Paenibacillus phyllosphaerae]MBB3108200.1 lysophospholipase L1-like esterase [Paenibacillus phyllosphaerae]
MSVLQPKDVILFQGDSITDCWRNHGDPSHLGMGYPYLLAAELGREYPELGLTFLNRGISGNRVVDLQQRWEKDCLALSPTLVSIYIGINDTWRRYDSNDPTSAEQFYEGYRQLITRTLDRLDARLVLIEPFVLPVPADRKGWREDLDPKIQAVRELSREFKTAYVPLDGLFAAASAKVDPAYWAGDGVHPTAAGQSLIAKAWREAVGL